jgi:hypothetical protein
VIRDNAREAKDEPDFRPFELDVTWRVTFESPRLLSLSGLRYFEQGGAHPNGAYDSIVWDKPAGRAVPLADLFAPAKRAAALKAIAASAKAGFRKKYPPDGEPDGFDPVSGEIAADPGKLGHYALTYAAGETKANGLVLLWGQGEAWPNVIGEVRLSVPVSVFRAWLAPQWAGEFK